MKKLTIYLFFLTITAAAFAQSGWNWPEDEGKNAMAKEKQAHYKLLMAKSEFSPALKDLNWLYANTPNLNPSIYIHGVDCIDDMIKTASSDRKEQLQDSILWMFDQRMVNFDNDASTMDRKAYKAFQLYYKTPSKYKLLSELYAKAYEMNGPEISNFNLNTYMLLAKNYHKTKPSEMTAVDVLDIHSLITDIIEQKRQAGESPTRLDKEQDKTDAWLESIPGILNCAFIEEKLVPKFRADPTDLNTAKKIFKYSVKSKCTDQPYFLEASEPVFVEQPSFALASAIGNKYLVKGDLAKGIQFHEEAQKIATTNEERYDALMGQANGASKLGNKTRSRKLAYEALSEKPGGIEAYNLIGNLYFTSFDDCKEQKSQVQDRAMFIAAYEMYEKAGNKSQMEAAKAQFPSIENIFSEGKEEGSKVTIGCWMNVTVPLKRR
ncbi:MAG: tetratricopeptide repeat protein [Ekhidna sp.]